MAGRVLPPLVERWSPNQSTRAGVEVDLLVLHETAGAYAGAVSWLCQPRSQASAHLVLREDGLEATQLVPLSRKAWAQCAYNPRAISLELANTSAKGYSTEAQLEIAARIFGWLCQRYSIPPRWSRTGALRGVTRHADLGAAGCGHTDCGPDLRGWQHFLELLAFELERGHFRHDWATI